MNKKPVLRKKFKLLPYLLILPTLFFVVLFTVFPAIASIFGSFYKQRLNIPKYREPVFSGFDNYINLFTDQTFLLILKNTVLYALVLVPLTLTVSLMFALWLNKKQNRKFRVAVFHPAILPMVSAATIWKVFLTPGYGLFNQFLKLLGYSGPQNWISNPDMSLWSLLIIQFWKDAGFYMIFYLAGLQNLPGEVFESAKLEGAGPVRIFFKLTLPLLKRTTLFVTTILVIGSFRTVDHVFIVTQGGPSNRSSLLMYHLWQVRFEYLNIGEASTITVVLIALLLSFTISNFLLSERRGTND
jgi:sn-glycerol 3-phosphate transport system permease protein